MSGALVHYERARLALSEAARVDEVLSVIGDAERLRLYGRQAKDKGLVADAAEIQLRAERRLGEMIAEAKDKGLISPGQPPKNGSGAEPFSRTTLAEAGIDKKLSMKSQRLAAIPEADFAMTLATAREKILSSSAIVIDPLRDLTTAEKQHRRADKELALGATQKGFPYKRYGVILADPAWKFATRSEATGMDRAPENHYPTQTLADIMALPVASIAADDCVLFIWTTLPCLAQAMTVIDAWGFAYKSNYVWVKHRAGTGYWSRARHEHLLVATRGGIPCPAPGTQWDSVIDAPATEHSAKPPRVLEMIEDYYPSVPKIELNRRGPARAGWDAWGNEAGPAERSEEEAAA